MQLDTKELKKITILYVEDDVDIRKQTETVFTKLFKKVFIANDGREGLKVFKQNHEFIDAIVSDINMPYMNGLEMIKEINYINSSIPTIFTTAHTESDYILDAIDLNIDKYIPKPLKIKELIVSIVDLVTKYRQLNNMQVLAKNLVKKTTVDANINERLKYSLDIAEKENKYMSMIIDNFVSTFEIDKNGAIIHVSSKFCRFFDYVESEVIGKNINVIRCDSSKSESFQKLMLKAIHTRSAVVSTHTLITSTNKSIECGITLTPKYGANTIVDGYIIYLDV